jgi:hypothetical protein
MGTVTGYTAERMKAIEDASVVNGEIDPATGHLILTRFDASEIDAGLVVTSPKVVTSGTRPTGGALFDGLLIYETDTKRFYSYDGAAWVYRGGVIICTSATRPASPFSGLEIYETDTKKKLMYDGAVWVTTAYLGAWDTYVPIFGAAAVNPNIGSTGFKTGRFRKIGRAVDFRIDIGFGGTGVNAGSGNYYFGLPAANRISAYEHLMGEVRLFIGGGAVAKASLQMDASNDLLVRGSYPGGYPSGAEAIVGPTTPFAIGSGSQIAVIGRYESAA